MSTFHQIADAAAQHEEPADVLQLFRGLFEKKIPRHHQQRRAGEQDEKGLFALEDAERGAVVEIIAQFHHAGDQGHAAQRREVHGGPELDTLVNDHQQRGGHDGDKC